MSEKTRSILSSESCLITQPKIVDLVGRTEAMVLQQIHYWIQSDNSLMGVLHKGMRYIYNSYKAWAENLHIYSERTVRRAITKLIAMGILISDTLHKFKGNRTKWYTIDYNRLNSLLEGLNAESRSFPHVAKMAGWCGQNGHIYNDTKITSETTGLNNAHARKTLSSFSEETKQPEIPESFDQEETIIQQDISLQTPDIESEPSPEDFLKALEVITEKLDQPLKIHKRKALKAIENLKKSDLGTGRGALERFKDYCTSFASNAYLMGQKVMKSGEKFTISAGTIFSSHMIECWREKKKYFYVYEEKQSSLSQEQEDDMGRRKQAVPLPSLSLEEAMSDISNPFDKAVKTKLYQVLGESTYKSWIHATGFIATGLSRGEPDFTISSQFAKDYVITHYREQLKKAFCF